VRLEERAGELVLRTDLVAFRRRVPRSRNTHLLVYSVGDGERARLVTAFPVERSFVERLLAPEGLGDDRRIAPRYNAAVEGPLEARGSRRIVSRAR
jgi:hypothetical protein